MESLFCYNVSITNTLRSLACVRHTRVMLCISQSDKAELNYSCQAVLSNRNLIFREVNYVC